MANTIITVNTASTPDNTPVEVQLGVPVNIDYTGTIMANKSDITIPEADLVDVESVEVTVNVNLASETLTETINIIPSDNLPTIIAPVAGSTATSASVDFEWSGYANYLYKLQVYSNSNRTQLVIDTNGNTMDSGEITATTHTFSNDPSNGTNRYPRLYWGENNSLAAGNFIDWQYTAVGDQAYAVLDIAAAEASFLAKDSGGSVVTQFTPGDSYTVEHDWVDTNGAWAGTGNIIPLSASVGTTPTFIERIDGTNTNRLDYFPPASNATQSPVTFSWGKYDDDTLTTSKVANKQLTVLAGEVVDPNPVEHGGPPLQSNFAAPTRNITSRLALGTTAVQSGTNVIVRRLTSINAGQFGNYVDSKPVHEYSHVPQFSSDGTRININSNSFDLSNYSPGPMLPHGAISQWGIKEPSKHYGFAGGGTSTVFTVCDKLGGGNTTVRNMADFGFNSNVNIGNNEGTIAYDDSCIGINDTVKLGIYDIVNDRMSNTYPLPTNYNWHSVTPSGKYMVVNQDLYSADSGYRRLWAYTRNTSTNQLSNPRLIHHYAEHAALLLDASGDDWIYMVGSPHMFIRVKDAFHVLCNQSGFGHCSGAAYLPGWVGFSVPTVLGMCKLQPTGTIQAITNNNVGDNRNMNTVSSYTYDQQSNLDACWQIWARHESSNSNTVEPCLSGDGKRFAYKSNFGASGNEEWLLTLP